MLLNTPDLEKTGSKRSSYILDHIGDMNDPSGPVTDLDKNQKLKDQQLSAYLRQDKTNNTNGSHHSPQSSFTSQRSGQRSSGDRPSGTLDRPRASFMTGHSPTRTNSDSPAGNVARPDLRASAEKILYTYLLPGAEREIILPQGLLNDIVHAIEEEGRDDPEVFDAAQDYTFQAMERDAFPGFLRAKALGNLVPPSSFVRLCIGLLAMFGGFWAGFACILLDKPKHVRCWVSHCLSTTAPHQANEILAHSSLHHRHLLDIIPAIWHRPCPRSCRTERVHLPELVTYSRTVCPQVAQQARSNGPLLHGPPRCLPYYPVHIRSRTPTIARLKSLFIRYPYCSSSS